MGEQAPFYIFTAFVFSYGTTVLGTSRDLILIAVLTASVISFFTIPFSGYLSDRIGRKRMYLLGAASTGVFAFLYYFLLNTSVPGLIFLAIVLSLIPHDMMYGPQAALIAESFTGRLRYSGASLGYQLASLIAGGPAPLSLRHCLRSINPATSSPPISWLAVSSAWCLRRSSRTIRIRTSRWNMTTPGVLIQ